MVNRKKTVPPPDLPKRKHCPSCHAVMFSEHCTKGGCPEAKAAKKAKEKASK